MVRHRRRNYTVIRYIRITIRMEYGLNYCYGNVKMILQVKGEEEIEEWFLFYVLLFCVRNGIERNGGASLI